MPNLPPKNRCIFCGQPLPNVAPPYRGKWLQAFALGHKTPFGTIGHTDLAGYIHQVCPGDQESD